MTISISTDGTYSVGVNEDTWLFSAPTFFNADGKRYSAKHGLDLWQTTANSGSDVLGQWQAINFFYSAGQWNITASIKTYNKPDLPLVIFQQVRFDQLSLLVIFDQLRAYIFRSLFSFFC